MSTRARATTHGSDGATSWPGWASTGHGGDPNPHAVEAALRVADSLSGSGGALDGYEE